MKKLILLFTLIPVLTWAFPVYTNRLDFDPAQSTGAFDDFLWRWSGFDDQSVEFLFRDVTVSNVGFRLAYPQRGRTFLDVLPPRTTNSLTVVTNEVLDVYTNFYPAIFNKVTDRGATNLTVTLNYSNGVFLSRSVVTNSSRVGSVQNTELLLAATSVVYTQSSAIANTEAYGEFTNQYGVSDNTTVTVSNFLENKKFEVPINGIYQTADFQQGGVSPNSYTGTFSSFIVPVYVFTSSFSVVSGNQYVVEFSAQTTGPFVSSFLGNVFYPIPYDIVLHGTKIGRLPGAIYYQTTTQNIELVSGKSSFVATNTGNLLLYLNGQYTGRSISNHLTGINYFRVASGSYISPYQSINTNTVTLPATNVVEFAFPSTQRVSRIYSKTETPYSKVTFSIPRTNIPPDGPYFAEVLTYSGATATNPTQSRTLAKGQVTIENSIWGITNYAGYTNYPGPWSYLLQDGSRPMAGDLNMGGNAVTNIGTNGLRFASGAYITPTDVATWNSFISSTSGLNAGTVFGGSVTGTYNNLTLRKDVLDNMEFLDLTTAPTSTTLSAGRMIWDADRETYQFGMDAAITQDIGHQTFAQVKNAESVTISNGMVVYIAGASGDKATVKIASYSNDTLSARTIGIAAEDIDPNGTGFVVTSGPKYNQDTSAFSEGAMLYLGAYGNLTTNRPQAPLHGVFIGVAEKINANAGVVFVKVQNGFEIDELHDVNVGSPATNDLLIYNGTVWTNYARTNLSGIYLPLAGGTLEGNLDLGGGDIDGLNAISFASGRYIDSAGIMAGGDFTFSSVPVIPGYQTLTGGVNAANLTNLSAIAGSGLGVAAGQLVVTNAFATTNQLAAYLPLAGGTMSGNINIGSSKIVWTNESASSSNSIEWLFADGSDRNAIYMEDIADIVIGHSSAGRVTIRNLTTSGIGDLYANFRGNHFGNAANLTNFPSLLTVSQGNTNYWRITTAPTNATESGQRGQIAVSSSNVFIYNPDALGAGTGRWIRIQGSISWP